MLSSQLGPFVNSRPFELFSVFVADGRSLDITHPEMVMMAEFALGLWVFYSGGQVEVIDANLICALQTLGPVDPNDFTGHTEEVG